MWPRRNQEARAKEDAPPSQQPQLQGAAAAAPVKDKSVAAVDTDDCGWLIRAKAKAKSKKSADANTTSKKRSLDSSKAQTKPKAKVLKLPIGIGWSKPRAPPVAKKELDREPLEHATAARGESFEEVYAEVFGVHKRPRPHAVAVEAEEAPALPMNTAVFMPDAPLASTAGQVPSVTEQRERQATKTKQPQKQGNSQWEFSASASIELDSFSKPVDVDSTKGQANADTEVSQAFTRWKDEFASHAVSDNFVRLNMRKRVKGSTGKAKKRPDYLRSGSIQDDTERAKKSTQSTNNSTAGGSGSLLDDGVDFIEECLELLQRHEASAAVQQPLSQPIESPRCHHSLVSTRVLVKKKNKNHGRAFYACPLGYDEGRCDFFLWEDNHTQFALHHLFGQPQASEEDATTSSTTPTPSLPNLVPLDISKPLSKQTKSVLTNLRVVFGHAEFRPGQQWAIERVFARKRTLLVLPTGAGKSLCYQYPALFLPGVTIVISPLVSLMNDQFHNLPPVLQAQATCVTAANSSKTQYAEFVRDLLGGKLKLLFVSPEKALTTGFQHLLMQMQSRISLVCIDEAHCISEWSHHFRPSYLRLQSIFALADSVLSITATASRVVERDILSQLHCDRRVDPVVEDSVLRMPWQRDNLQLRVVNVSSDDERLERLCEVLIKTPISGAIIMYVHQQWQAEAMANLLQERLVVDASASAVNKWTKTKIGFYHAKMEAEAKEKVRVGFLNGRVKLVIATIAFGMGIDKQNVRLVIHYHVPSSIEHYLQQVGRAGRDGRPASALLFLLHDDVRAFRSLLYSNALHIDQVQRLVTLLMQGTAGVPFHPDTSRGMVQLAPSSRVQRLWMRVDWLEPYLDMKAATIETFLTLLSLHPTVQHAMKLTLRPTAMSWCTITLTQVQLKSATADPFMKQLVAVVMTDDTHEVGHVDVDIDGYHQQLTVHFHVAALARRLFPASSHTVDNDASDPTIDVQARRLMQSVRAWQSNGHIRKYRMEWAAFDVLLTWDSVVASEDQRRQCIGAWASLLYAKHEALEAVELDRLKHLFTALSSAARPASTVQRLAESDVSDAESEDTQILEQHLTSYFESSPNEDVVRLRKKAVAVIATSEGDGGKAAAWRSLTSPLTPDLIESIGRDVEALTSRSPDQIAVEEDSVQVAPCVVAWHGYNVARIFHGLASPCFPSKQWRDQIWWRKYAHVAFEQLVVIADRIVTQRLKGDQ